ncbi:uncharacterized protein LOC105702835 isoform X2 [Orussus abietinus]|uniref:uncharacterized protein LOC105702835 isoform X2 n=1 Tax=Orussus abietinus TaxID=222816 RepID=UPI0006252733|nr:uncharacterized protein LOC105702835 isoform X2 [Orussus abietinus]
MWFHRETNSIFYVDSDYESLSISSSKMETEVRNLKQELARTRDALKVATKRCRDLVRELDNRTAGLETERTLRDQQLSRILRALLVLEGRLKQEQKSIRQLLCEKDNVIRNQQLEIAKLRRYTKNYIKSKREQTLGRSSKEDQDETSTEKTSADLQSVSSSSELGSRPNSSLSKDIHNLKCEIITKLNAAEDEDRQDHGIRKMHSFAGSDISKTSLTSSENTDASIITTTTEGSPSLLSTEGFCEGESTDVSPGSTLNKSTRCTPTTVTDSENETTLMDDEEPPTTEKRRLGVIRAKQMKNSKRAMARCDSNDDGLDCNFVSEDEDEPIYANSCTEANVKNLEERAPTIITTRSDVLNRSSNVEPVQDQTLEETSGNWYSDPDEDRVSDDVFRHNSYRPNSNHNSVLECVNQILLRDMEEEENVLSVPRRFKHRGRIVRFQPARLSDIESVGSEMERRNSDEATTEKEQVGRSDHVEEVAGFEGTASEDEFGMRMDQPPTDSTERSLESTSSAEEESEEPKVIPIVIIEPKSDFDERRILSHVAQHKIKTTNQPVSPTLNMERIEEKTCLQMSTKGLTIAKNLDYEDIESLPEVIPSVPKTPPALPPKPQFKNNTLVLKKIPSPSFLIDETRKKNGIERSERAKCLFGFGSSPGLGLEEEPTVKCTKLGDPGFGKNRFNDVRSSFQTKQSANTVDLSGPMSKKTPRVTNIVRHFEEFKIGGDTEDRSREPHRHRDRPVADIEQDFDIRQNFEEFNLDECDLSDDPDRLEGDGSDRLGNLVITNHNENQVRIKENENVLNGGYDHFLEATGLSNKSILTPSRLLSNHKSMLKPKDIKYKNKIKATAIFEKHGISVTSATHTHVKHWTGPFV